MRNQLLTNRHNLVIFKDDKSNNQEDNKCLEELCKHFCGSVHKINQDADLTKWIETLNQNSNFYMCGQVKPEFIKSFPRKDLHLYVIAELTDNIHLIKEMFLHLVISIGQVPTNVYNCGLLFNNFFTNQKDSNYFESICREHKFQSLTESNKPSFALRSGVYLTPVIRICDNHDTDTNTNNNNNKEYSKRSHESLAFHLLRCSSNFSGPTETFSLTDYSIVSKVNETCSNFFSSETCLNHVLAQVYHNNGASKAKIKAHSDKTKDMPENGLIAFCTFYDNLNDMIQKFCFKEYGFDLLYKDISAFPSLYFKKKEDVSDSSLPTSFHVKLYPNSLFVIPLSTNRLYTHEIRPSALPSEMTPTRLGYVIRCSKTLATFDMDENKTKITGVCLDENPTQDDVNLLRQLYFEENMTSKIINYDDHRNHLNFSLNKGDYMKPIV